MNLRFEDTDGERSATFESLPNGGLRVTLVRPKGADDLSEGRLAVVFEMSPASLGALSRTMLLGQDAALTSELRSLLYSATLREGLLVQALRFLAASTSHVLAEQHPELLSESDLELAISVAETILHSTEKSEE